MSNVLTFELILISLIAIIGLELLAKRLKLPPAAALLVGGVALAFVPGLPTVELDPELILVVFLPPLLMDGAYLTVWEEFKRNLGGILLLAIGAVTFTTVVVGVVTHMLLPTLPWGVCFALGAIISPPDAIAAKAVLNRVSLPRRIMVLLEGESLLNDASGLVLYRFALVAGLTGSFSLSQAIGKFAMLCIGGLAVGLVIGYIVIKLLRFLSESYLVIVSSILPAWGCYVVGEALDVSGVVATVTYGMIFGWYQHEVLSATERTRGSAFWQIVMFLLESLVFILIGLSLRGVISRLGGYEQAALQFGPTALTIACVLIASRFVWIFGIDGITVLWKRATRPDARKLDWRGATIKSWAGMRGVVTLAVALSLPADLPGHDLILVTSFVVILVTVLIQGSTIGPLIDYLELRGDDGHAERFLNEAQSWARLEMAQYEAVKKHAYDENGLLRHPRLLEQYAYRARISDTYKDEVELPVEARRAHYNVVLAALAAAREELLALHRSDQIHDQMLHMLEHDLDLQEMTAIHSRGP
jgi:Na+/H+ antiporter